MSERAECGLGHEAFARHTRPTGATVRAHPEGLGWRDGWLCQSACSPS